MSEKKLYPIISIGTPLKLLKEMGRSCTDEEFNLLVNETPFYANIFRLLDVSDYAFLVDDEHIASYKTLMEFRAFIESKKSLEEKYKKIQWMYNSSQQFKELCDLEGFPDTIKVIEMSIVRELELYGLKHALLLYESGYRNVRTLTPHKIDLFSSQFMDAKEDVRSEVTESLNLIKKHMDNGEINVWWENGKA